MHPFYFYMKEKLALKKYIFLYENIRVCYSEHNIELRSYNISIILFKAISFLMIS